MTLPDLLQHFPRQGKLTWIGLRTGYKKPLISASKAMADTESGLKGDHYHGKSFKRQVTLIQHEHMAVIESLTGTRITPNMLRRNLVIEGINLLALKKLKFSIGDAVFLTTGHCHPCSRMEKTLGPGGYNAMRGHGGITAQVIKDGIIRIGDSVIPFPEDT